MTNESKRPSGGPPSKRALSRQIGMSRSKMWRAEQVANIPEDEFERLIESDEPPTVTELVQRGRTQSETEAKQHTSLDTLKRAWRKASEDERAAFLAWVGRT